MGLFDIFTFKRDAGKVFSSENISKLFQLIREKIIELIKEEVTGKEKKDKLDKFIISFIEVKTKECTNKYVLWLVDKLIDEIPRITQIVYDLLKEKIENL